MRELYKRGNKNDIASLLPKLINKPYFFIIITSAIRNESVQEVFLQ